MFSKRLTVVTALSICVYGMEATLLGTLLPELAKTFTPAQNGTIASVQSLGLIAASLATGPVLDRLGAKAGVMTGLAVIAIALGFLPSAHSYPAVLLALTLIGLGGGVISTSTNTMASQLGGRHQASMLNRLNVFFGLGGLATPALGAVLSMTALSLCIVVFAAVTMLLWATTPAAHTPRRKSDAPGADFRQLLRPLFVLLCLFLFLYVSCEVGVWNWLAAYLTGKGMAKNSALRILSFGFATGIIAGRAAGARLLTRFHAENVTLVCSLGMVVSTSAILLAASPLRSAVAVFCAGLTMAPVYPTTLGMVSVAFPRGTATAIGVAVTTGWVGVAISSKIIGAIAGSTPDSMGRALLVIPACAVLMVLVNLVFRRFVGRKSTVAA